MWPVFAIVTAVCTGIVLWADATDRNTLRGIAKVAASAGFLGVALARDAHHGGAVGTCLLVALVLSAVGDISLIGKSKRAVAGGLAAFFLAHVAFVATFAAAGMSAVALLGTLAVFTVVVPPIWRWLMPHTGSLYSAVAGYITVIVLMVASAGGALGAEPGWLRLFWLLCAATFFASDLFVARQRFVTPHPINRRVGLPLYYAAQLGFAYGMTAP